MPTTSGMLLFGKHPQEFLPQSGIVFVRFVGTEPRGKDGLAGYGRRAEMEGPLARLVEAAWNIIWQEMRVGAVVVGLKREEQPEYPGFAVREALVNAIAHRDYRLTGRRVEIRMFEDRLEVISPGGLPGYITVDNIVEEHFSRNPRLVAGLFQWGYIEELGLGIDRMIEEMLQHGHPSPEFKATPYSFTVTLRNTRERRPDPGVGTQHERAPDARAGLRARVRAHHQPRVPRPVPHGVTGDAAPRPGRPGGEEPAAQDRRQTRHLLHSEVTGGGWKNPKVIPNYSQVSQVSRTVD